MSRGVWCKLTPRGLWIDWDHAERLNEQGQRGIGIDQDTALAMLVIAVREDVLRAVVPPISNRQKREHDALMDANDRLNAADVIKARVAIEATGKRNGVIPCPCCRGRYRLHFQVSAGNLRAQCQGGCVDFSMNA